MVDFEPPGEGPPFSNGHDVADGRVTASLARLDERTKILGQTVSTLQGEIKNLPTKTTLNWIVGIFLTVLGLIVIAYWNGLSGKFEGVNGKFEAVNAKIDAMNGKLDSVARAIDRLTPPVASAPTPLPRRRR